MRGRNEKVSFAGEDRDPYHRGEGGTISNIFRSLCVRATSSVTPRDRSPDFLRAPRMPATVAHLMVQAGAVRGFVDLHCHWIAGIDDGATTPAEGLAMLRALRGAGFDFVMATPHMRPAMFDNRKENLTLAFQAMAAVL